MKKKPPARKKPAANKKPAARKPAARKPAANKKPAARKPAANEKAALTVGKPAPGFTLPSSTGGTVSLADLAGKPVVLYFYPRDNTPGCTREACDFQASLAAFARLGAVVLGVSKDSLASHDKFAGQYGLRFPLLSDADSKVMAAYGAWGEKTLYGKKFVGTIRTTVLIDRRGVVARVWPSVKVDGHAAAVLDAVRAL